MDNARRATTRIEPSPEGLIEVDLRHFKEAYPESLVAANIQHFEGGAKRSKDADPWRFDLIPSCALRRLAAIYKEGAEKYGPANYKSGIPFSNIVNHLENHLHLWMVGNDDEDHLAKVMWGIATIMWFQGNNRDDLDDIYDRNFNGDCPSPFDELRTP